MSSPARSSSLISTATASWYFSRNRMSSMQVSSGRPHMLTSNQRGLGHDPVTVLGRIRSLVTVNAIDNLVRSASFALTRRRFLFRSVERHGRADERLQRPPVDLLAFVD